MIGEHIGIAAYLLVGIILAQYWFKRDYEQEYNENVKKNGFQEKGIGCIILLMMALFWSIVLFKNVIIYRTI